MDENPVTSEEEAQDLDLKVEQMRLMKTLVDSPGWQKLLLPYIEGRKKGLFLGFRNAKKIEEFLSTQQCYNTLDHILSFVNNVLTTGEQAHKKLHPTK